MTESPRPETAALALLRSSAPTDRFLFAPLVDDSRSIGRGSNRVLIAAFYNQLLLDLRAATESAPTSVLLAFLNRPTQHQQVAVEDAPLLSLDDYPLTSGTPLYDRSYAQLRSVRSRVEEHASAGCQLRTFTLLLTDGGDSTSRSYAAADVRREVEQLRADGHIVAGFGISDGRTDFRGVFHRMGIPDAWIRTPEDCDEAVRDDFTTTSRSVVLAADPQRFDDVSRSGFRG